MYYIVGEHDILVKSKKNKSHQPHRRGTQNTDVMSQGTR